MPETKGMNKYQKAVSRLGEVRVDSNQIKALLQLSCSVEVEDRLTAAEYLCPCHVRTRIPAVWDALFRMMQDADKRVRQQAWHTIEDGGKPTTSEALETVETICSRETDPKVRCFAEHTLDQVLGSRRKQQDMELRVAHLASRKKRSKCDFCGATNVLVERDLQTMMPAGNFPRIALICGECLIKH